MLLKVQEDCLTWYQLVRIEPSLYFWCGGEGTYEQWMGGEEAEEITENQENLTSDFLLPIGCHT